MHVLKCSGEEYEVIDFFPYGYDERQFCSPGFNLPVGCLMQTPHGCFPEYHTSADDLQFVQPAYLADSLSTCLSLLNVLENNKTYMNQNPKGEPQLGKRQLYEAVGGQIDRKIREFAMLWVLNLSDGNHTLLDIAEKSGLEFSLINSAAHILSEYDLLKECEV
jgi:aminopeptidase-like protein